MRAAPFVSSKSEAKPIDTPYEEPFKGYNDYIEKLKQHIGEEVCIQESFEIIKCSDSKKLERLDRYDNSNSDLFPHRVSFDDGSTINLRGIVSITGPEVNQMDINPEDESIFYLDIPKQKKYEKFWHKYLGKMREDFRKYS